jgi:hypothetical protein
MAEDELDKIITEVMLVDLKQYGLPNHRESTVCIDCLKAAINAYTTNKIIEELENIPRVSDFNNEVDEYINKRIAELKALNHRKENS